MRERKFDKIMQPDGYISAAPSPTREELNQFYAELYYQTPQSCSYQNSYEDIELKYKRLKCDALLYAFKRQGVSEGEFLDIGAGEGFLMHAAHQSGFSVSGIDFSSFGIDKYFPELRNRLIVGDIYESIGLLKVEGKRFMACSTINVLEHVIDPALFLSDIREALDEKGLLAITVPNDFSVLQNELLKEHFIEREFWFGPPQHLHYFNAKNLPSFCTGRGYELVDAFSDFPIDLFLLHPGSNYIMNSQNGPSAHRARMLHDLMIAQEGLEKYLSYYRSMFQVGLGRDITVILRPSIE